MSESRRFQSGRSYHVTHRCHDRAFLLGTDINRREYLRLMWDASRRREVSILSYILTGNHVHLLLSSERLEGMAGFMSHVSGGMSHFHNRRKNRTGAFWEGRYHAALIQDNTHLSRCLFYIALNMVRAGVVDHPGAWRWSSHQELTGERRRYRMVDMELLLRKLRIGSSDQFIPWYTRTIDAMSARPESLRREPWWSAASCVGDLDFIGGMSGGREPAGLDGNLFWV